MASNTNSLIVFNEKYSVNDKMRLDVSPKYKNFNTGSPYFIILFTYITDYNINIEVYDDINTTANQLINAGLNNLFGEVIWFYCS